MRNPIIIPYFTVKKRGKNILWSLLGSQTGWLWKGKRIYGKTW